MKWWAGRTGPLPTLSWQGRVQCRRAGPSAACPFSDRLSPRTAAPARGPWLGLSGLPTRQEPFSSQLGRFFSYKVKEFIKWKQRLKSGDFSSCLSLGEGEYGPPVCKGAAVNMSQWGGPLCPRPHLPYRVQRRRPRASRRHVGGHHPHPVCLGRLSRESLLAPWDLHLPTHRGVGGC